MIIIRQSFLEKCLLSRNRPNMNRSRTTPTIDVIVHKNQSWRTLTRPPRTETEGYGPPYKQQQYDCLPIHCCPTFDLAFQPMRRGRLAQA